MIFGIISVGSHDTIGSGGRKCGYMMGIVDLEGRKYFVDISEQTYADLVGIYAATNQLHQDVSMGVASPQPVSRPPEAEIGVDPTGTPEEVERMRELLSEVDVMKKLGFVSDDAMQQARPVNDPVEDILSMASSEEEEEEEYEEEYEDPGETDFGEGVEGI